MPLDPPLVPEPANSELRMTQVVDAAANAALQAHGVVAAAHRALGHRHVLAVDHVDAVVGGCCRSGC